MFARQTVACMPGGWRPSSSSIPEISQKSSRPAVREASSWKAVAGCFRLLKIILSRTLTLFGAYPRGATIPSAPPYFVDNYGQMGCCGAGWMLVFFDVLGRLIPVLHRQQCGHEDIKKVDGNPRTSSPCPLPVLSAWSRTNRAPRARQ